MDLTLDTAAVEFQHERLVEREAHHRVERQRLGGAQQRSGIRQCKAVRHIESRLHARALRVERGAIDQVGRPDRQECQVRDDAVPLRQRESELCEVEADASGLALCTERG
ncbi:MAG: hypothetical protein ACREF0_20780, partial [Acetobacteraceae bacterium]